MAEERPKGLGVRELYISWLAAHGAVLSRSALKTHNRARDLIEELQLHDHPTVQEIAEFQDRLLRSGRYGSRRSVSNFRGSIARWYEHGNRLGTVAGNPAHARHPAWLAAEVKQRQSERFREPVNVSDSDLQRLVFSLEPRDRLFILFCRYLGVRPSEARGVRAFGALSDFSRDKAGSLQVRIARQRFADPSFETFPLKAGERTRLLTIVADLEFELEPFLPPHGDRPTVRIGKGGGSPVEVDFLFPMHSKTQVTRLNKAMQATGLIEPKQGAYVMRHSFMRAATEARQDMRDLQVVAGHAWISSTQGYVDRSGHQPASIADVLKAAAPKLSTGLPVQAPNPYPETEND